MSDKVLCRFGPRCNPAWLIATDATGYVVHVGLQPPHHFPSLALAFAYAEPLDTLERLQLRGLGCLSASQRSCLAGDI